MNFKISYRLSLKHCSTGISRKKAKGPGTFGTVVAFARADEEEYCITLHLHIQLWVKEIDQKLRKDIFQEDTCEEEKARIKF